MLIEWVILNSSSCRLSLLHSSFWRSAWTLAEPALQLDTHSSCCRLACGLRAVAGLQDWQGCHILCTGH